MSVVLERLLAIHPSDTRFRLVRDWRSRAGKGADVFEQYFFAYLALVAAARTSTDNAGAPDERAVKDLFTELSPAMRAVAGECMTNLTWFADRNLPGGQQLLDLRDSKASPADRDALLQLAAHLDRGPALTDRRLAQCLAVLLCTIRNNLFHGLKDYRDQNDTDVLGNAVPIILAVISRFEQSAAAAQRGGF